MTAHELAQRLLDGPDLLVFISGGLGGLFAVDAEVMDAKKQGPTWDYCHPDDEGAVKVIVL